jgi:uncharacterized protein YbjT (DUF2867 family)
LKVLIIGGSGFIGSKITEALVTLGHRVTLPTRRRERAKHLIMLPTCDVIEANVYDAKVLTQLVAEQDVVINLVGILHGNTGAPYGSDWKRAHVELTASILQAISKQRYLHMSALGADSKGPSMYQRSKGDAETLVMNSNVAWTIFRPSVVFGPDDKFLNTFAQLQAIAPFVPLAGAACKFQPVHVDDVVAAFVKALNSDEAVHQSYELAGTEVFTLKQLVQLAGRAAGHERAVFGLPDAIARLQALAMKLLPGEPLLSADNLDSIKVDNTINARKNGLTELGISPKLLSASLDYLTPSYQRSQFEAARSHASR